MKKILLSFGLVFFVLSAAAGLPMKKFTSKFDARKTQKELKLQQASVMAVQAESVKGKKFASKRADGDENVFGTFIQKYDGEEVEGFVGASIETFYSVPDHPIEVEYVDDNDQVQTETVNCNIFIPAGAFGGYKTDGIYAVYEESEDGPTIWIPEQIVLHVEGVDEEEGAYNYDIYMLGLVYENGQRDHFTNGVFFEGDENGNFYCSSDSWVYYYIDHTTGTGLGTGGEVMNPVLMKTNGQVKYKYVFDDNDWTEVEAEAAIEDYKESVTLYGFFDTKLDFTIDDDCTVHMACGQPLYDKLYGVQSGFDFGYIHVVGTEKQDDDKWHMNLDLTEMTGTLEGNTISFPSLFVGISNYSEALGGAYGWIWFEVPYFKLNDGNFQMWDAAHPDGIEEKTMTREEYMKTTKTYNLMGQQVDRKTAKGILVRDGRKFIAK